MFAWITPQIAPILWLALGIVFAVTEGLTVQMTAIWFALGAAGGALTALLGGSPMTQFIVFVVLAAALLIFTRPFVKRVLTVKKESTNADRLIGETAVVLEEINNDLSTGRVSVSGLGWMARSVGGGVLAEGEKVRVLSIEGVKLMVEPCDRQAK